MKREHKLFMISALLFIGCIFAASAQVIVRGKLVQRGEAGDFPVTAMPVTILDPVTKERSAIVYSNAEGIFVIEDLRYVDYVIEIWKSGFKVSPLTYRISVAPPRVLGSEQFNSQILGPLMPDERQFISGFYKPSSDGKEYFLSSASFAPDIRAKFSATLMRTFFKYYFDVAPIDISPDKVLPFNRQPLKTPVF